jgi:hypothetical protein
MPDLRVENITSATLKAFRLRCIAADYSMREALIWAMEQVGKGAIRLPEKEE